MAMAVLLVGRQCCVSNSAMARYEARLWRNSTMTSFAGNQILELLWPERRKFRDRLADCGWIK